MNKNEDAYEHITPETLMFWLKTRIDTKNVEPSYREWKDIAKRVDQAINYHVTGSYPYRGYAYPETLGNLTSTGIPMGLTGWVSKVYSDNLYLKSCVSNS